MPRRRFPIRTVTFLAALAPLGWLIRAALGGGLGANPPSAIIDHTGEWSLQILLLTLLVTPLRRLTGWGWPGRIRRMLGLFAFFYAVVHFAAYAVFDFGLRLGPILADLVSRPFITVGFIALLGMVPLAATSTDGAMRRLGRWWPRLHLLIHPVAVLSVAHYYLLVKADIRAPITYALLLALLLGYRLLPRRWQKGPRR
jgi:sulfoxide reductase heme-binding subunit YedZ